MCIDSEFWLGGSCRVVPPHALLLKIVKNETSPKKECYVVAHPSSGDHLKRHFYFLSGLLSHTVTNLHYVVKKAIHLLVFCL